MGRNRRRRETKRQYKLQQLESPRTVNAERGTTLWAYNHYRRVMLTSLLNDLIDLENIGLEEEYCQIVQRSLGYFVNATTEVASGGFLTGNLHVEVERFERLYKEWNDINGTNPRYAAARRELLVKLRRRRQKITDKVKDLQFEFENGLDRKILADVYAAVGDLIKLAPDLMKNLGSSYAEYIKRGGFVTA